MFSLDYMESMMSRIVKISHTRGQTLIGIPKNLAIAAGLDKSDYAKIWLTEGKVMKLKGINLNDGKERDIQGDRYALDRSARGIVKT